MQIECILTNSLGLPEEYYSLGYTKKSQFDTTLTTQYSVYAVAVMEHCIMYLICDNFNVPNWYPAAGFKLIQKEIPSIWKFMYFNDDDYFSMIMGYPEIVEIREHYINLIERDLEALEIFNQAKLEIDLS